MGQAYCLFNSKISSAILLQELFQFGTKRPKVGFLHNHSRSKSNSLFSSQTQFKQAYDKTFLCKLMNSITLTVLSDLFNSFSVKFRDSQFTFISKGLLYISTTEWIKNVLILSITYKNNSDYTSFDDIWVFFSKKNLLLLLEIKKN